MYKWERREKKLKSRKQRMPKHGKNIGVIYKNAWEKREKPLIRRGSGAY
jgi:hypothetical protein